MNIYLKVLLKIIKAFIPSRKIRHHISTIFTLFLNPYVEAIAAHKDYFYRSFFYKEDKNQKFEVDLSIALIVKNESPYIKEWIEYHKLVGVQRFYIYDNESEDNLKVVLQPYIDSGVVVYHLVKGHSLQMPVFEDAIQKYKNESKYIAFIDCDEFIVPNKRDNILDVIRDVENNYKQKVYALAMNWKCFGYNGHYNKPKGLVVENFKKWERNEIMSRHIKCIINPRFFYPANNPHIFIPLLGKYTVNTSYNKIWSPFFVPVYDFIQLNHYYTKSYEEYKLKAARGRSDDYSLKYEVPEYNPDYFSVVDDSSILRFLPDLKFALSKDSVTS